MSSPSLSSSITGRGEGEIRQTVACQLTDRPSLALFFLSITTCSYIVCAYFAFSKKKHVPILALSPRSLKEEQVLISPKVAYHDSACPPGNGETRRPLRRGRSLQQQRRSRWPVLRHQ